MLPRFLFLRSTRLPPPDKIHLLQGLLKEVDDHLTSSLNPSHINEKMKRKVLQYYNTTPSSSMDHAMMMDTTNLLCEQPLSFDLEQARKDQQSTTTRSPKRVHFSDFDQISDSRAPLDLILDSSSGQELESLWYSNDDLARFKRHFKDDSRLLRATPQFVFNATNRCCSMAFDAETRGLEQYACLERLRRRTLTIRFVCKTQREVGRRRLATYSRRYTRWADRLAHEEALWDYEKAYGAPTPWNSGAEKSGPPNQGVGRTRSSSFNRDILAGIIINEAPLETTI